jgi:hypothetical protein
MNFPSVISQTECGDLLFAYRQGKTEIRKYLQEIRTIILKKKGSSQILLIQTLSPNIRAWKLSALVRHVIWHKQSLYPMQSLHCSESQGGLLKPERERNTREPKISDSGGDYVPMTKGRVISQIKKKLNCCHFFILKMLWRWASRRHSNKNKKWVKKKYFKKLNGKNWVFCFCLFSPSLSWRTRQIFLPIRDLGGKAVPAGDSARLLGRLRGHVILGDYVAGDSQGKEVAVLFRKLRAVFHLFNPSDFLPLQHSPCIQKRLRGCFIKSLPRRSRGEKKTQISDWHSPKGYGVADRDIRGKKEPNILNSAVGRAQNNNKFCFFCLPSADL